MSGCPGAVQQEPVHHQVWAGGAAEQCGGGAARALSHSPAPGEDGEVREFNVLSSNPDSLSNLATLQTQTEQVAPE